MDLIKKTSDKIVSERAAETKFKVDGIKDHASVISLHMLTITRLWRISKVIPVHDRCWFNGLSLG